MILNLLFSSLRIIELCHQFPHGITDQVIQNDMPHMEAQQRAMAINRLLSMVGESHLPHVISAQPRALFIHTVCLVAAC